MRNHNARRWSARSRACRSASGTFALRRMIRCGRHANPGCSRTRWTLRVRVGFAIHFLNEAHRHGKSIAAMSDGSSLRQDRAIARVRGYLNATSLRRKGFFLVRRPDADLPGSARPKARQSASLSSLTRYNRGILSFYPGGCAGSGTMLGTAQVWRALDAGGWFAAIRKQQGKGCGGIRAGAAPRTAFHWLLK